MKLCQIILSKMIQAIDSNPYAKSLNDMVTEMNFEAINEEYENSDLRRYLQE
jgi:hypothetical protein